jgi:hypothetical protein
VLQYVRSAAPVYINLSTDITFSGCRVINAPTTINYSSGVTVKNLDYIDRFVGKTNATSPFYAVSVIGGGDHTIDGLTFGTGLDSVHSYNGAFNFDSVVNVKFRNIGSYASPLGLNIWEPNLYAPAYLFRLTGYDNGVKIQRCAMRYLRADMMLGVNTDKSVLIESVFSTEPYIHANGTPASRILTLYNKATNGQIKGMNYVQGTSGQASVYGTHFHDLFMGKTYGQIALCMNEPTAETAPYFTMVSGTQKFNSAGGILMGVIGNQAIWEMPYFALGHTGFVNEAVAMSGGTIGNYTLEYAIDTGAGYSAWKTLNGTNLSGETISPSTGFKLKIRITTTTTNTTAITFLLIRTTTTESAQSTNFYPLDTNTVTFTGLPAGCDAVVLAAGSTTILDQRDSLPGTSYSYTYSGAQNVDVGFIKPGYIPFYIRNLALTATDSSIPVSLTADRNYQ